MRHPCNLGIGAAVQTGFLYGLTHGYDYVVRQDGDGQHDPAQIPRLLEVLRGGEADIVVGSRFLAREGYQSTWCGASASSSSASSARWSARASPIRPRATGRSTGAP